MTDAPRTVLDVLAETARVHGDRPALRYKRGGAWQSTTWRAYREGALRVGRALLALGAAPKQGVVILGYNAPEWVLADVGAICSGAWPAGIYTTSSAEQCRYVAHHCEARVAIVDTAEQANKLLSIKAELPALQTIVQWSGDAGAGVLGWDAFLAKGDAVPEADLDVRMKAQEPDDVCTLIYTSGTTGNPKAVMISHRNCTWVAQLAVDLNRMGPDDVGVSYLPLSHIAEQMLTIHVPMRVGCEIGFAESLEQVGAALQEIRPTAFFAVPRVWEKIQAKMTSAGASAPPLRKKIVAWARKQGLRGGYALQRGERTPLLYGLANRLVFTKVQERLGLDRARICSSGAAPISKDTLEFFLALGIPIREVYGMSECTGPATVNTPDRYRTGRAGFVIPGSEVKIADDGEICIRGPHVFKGYLKDPEATAAAVDADGWLHSGDIGKFDDEGFLQITDRKKELIITAGGENISPQLVEGHLTSIPVVAQAVVIGDRRRYLAALVTLDPERVAIEAKAAGSLAREAGEASRCPVFRAHLEQQIEAVNQRLARVQTVKKFAILTAELTIDGGELTPTMKLKRRVIHAKYKDEIEKLYA
jgi:long-subunit acyl-CoA synthetase (AMP-forming)